MKKLTAKQIAALKALAQDGRAKVNGHTTNSLAGLGLIRWQKDAGAYTVTPSGVYLLEQAAGGLVTARPPLPTSGNGSRLPAPIEETARESVYFVRTPYGALRLYRATTRALRQAEYLHGPDCGCPDPSWCLVYVLALAEADLLASGNGSNPGPGLAPGWYVYGKTGGVSVPELPPELARFTEGEPATVAR